MENQYKKKLRALLVGLGARNIDMFMNEAKVGDYINYGKIYIDRYNKLIEEKKILFITDDGVEITNPGCKIYLVNSNFEKSWYLAERCINLEALTKIFYCEREADEYIWKNKPLFSYEDFIRWGNVPYERVIKQLAKERIEG